MIIQFHPYRPDCCPLMLYCHIFHTDSTDSADGARGIQCYTVFTFRRHMCTHTVQYLGHIQLYITVNIQLISTYTVLLKMLRKTIKLIL